MPRLIVLILLVLTSWQACAEVRKYYVSKLVSLNSIASSEKKICNITDANTQDDLLNNISSVQDDIVQDNSLMLFSRAVPHFTNYFMIRIRQLYQLGIYSYTSQLLHRPPIL